MKAASRFAARHERKLILLLCAIAALRVFTFCAAFPFFNNVDEQAHLDLVVKYARGDVPRDLGHYSSESANSIALYGSRSYLWLLGSSRQTISRLQTGRYQSNGGRKS